MLGERVILGVGIDIESIQRLKRVREGVRRRIIDRILTEKEKRYCLGKIDPYPHIVARFCAKEAFVKALGVGDTWSISFKDVEILGHPPRILTRGKAKKILEEMGAKKVHVSLSHTSDYATAIVVIET